MLKESLEEPGFPPQEKQALLQFLTKYHHAFSLEDGERGETDLIYMEIDTREARPKKQPAGRVPFALRQEVAGQLVKCRQTGWGDSALQVTVVNPCRSREVAGRNSSILY